MKSSLHAREGHEYDALRRFREEHKGDDQARQREEQARGFRERWPGSERHAQVRTWEDDDRALARAQERRDEQRGDYEVLLERVKTLTAEEHYDRILEEYDRFLQKWPGGEQARLIRERKVAVLVARLNRTWAELVRFEQRNPLQHEAVIGKAKPFQVSSSASIRDQAQKMVARHETEWDRVDYDAVRKACNEAREPPAVARARQKALDYVRTEYPPRQRKAPVQKWLDWFEGLQKPRDYYITVREVDIPPGSGLRDLYGKEQVRVHIRIGAMVHKTGWNKGKGNIEIGEKIGPFRAEWGKEETIEVRAEEYDTISANDWSRGRKTDSTFVMFWADGPFSTLCDKNKDVKVYLECSQVVAPKLPSYESK